LKASLTIPRPWNLDSLTEQVGLIVGKPIRLLPQPDLTAGGFPCGIAIERTGDIVIVYDATSSGYHADHILLHEIGHLLLGHTGRAGDPRPGVIAALIPEIDPAGVLKVLARTDYDNDQESQAELFASLVMAESREKHRGSALRGTIFRG